jgi:sugar phosphate isomerase/epimerase
MPMTSKPKTIAERLSLCHGTLTGVPAPEFVMAAAAAGFRQVSLRVMGRGPQPGELLGDTSMRRETLRCLQGEDIKLLEAEAAIIHPDTAIASLEPLIESAAYLGAQGVIPVFLGQTSEAHLLDQLAAFAALAAGYGQRVLIEFISVSRIRSLADAIAILTKTPIAGAGIIVDSLHLARTQGSVAAVAAADPALLVGLQINDGPAYMAAQEDALWAEIIGGRSFPGEGEFDLIGLVAAAPAQLPIGIEVVSTKTQNSGLTPCEIARHARACAIASLEIE